MFHASIVQCKRCIGFALEVTKNVQLKRVTWRFIHAALKFELLKKGGSEYFAIFTRCPTWGNDRI